jgi:hypothetical protein
MTATIPIIDIDEQQKVGLELEGLRRLPVFREPRDEELREWGLGLDALAGYHPPPSKEEVADHFDG